MRHLELDYVKAIFGVPHLHDQRQWIFCEQLKFISVHDHLVSSVVELAKADHIAAKAGNVVYLLK